MKQVNLFDIQGGFLLPDGSIYGYDYYYPLIHLDIVNKMYAEGITNIHYHEIGDEGWIEIRKGKFQFPRNLEAVTEKQLEVLLDYCMEKGEFEVENYNAGRIGTMTKEILFDVLSKEVSRKSLGVIDQYEFEKSYSKRIH